MIGDLQYSLYYTYYIHAAPQSLEERPRNSKYDNVPRNSGPLATVVILSPHRCFAMPRQQLHAKHVFWSLAHPCPEGVMAIVLSLFPEVPGSIPEDCKKKKILWIRLFVDKVHLLSFLRYSMSPWGIKTPWRAIQLGLTTSISWSLAKE